MSNLVERARQLRPLIEKAAASLSDEDAVTAIELFPKWNGASVNYVTGDRVRYGETLYKCLSEHISQETWNPNDAPSLWARTDDPSIEYPEWIQPTGATDAYTLGAKVTHNDKNWISNVDANTWEPGVYGWDEVSE